MSQAIIAAQAQLPELVNRFVSFVDRGERTTKAYTQNVKQYAAYLAYTGRQHSRETVMLWRDWLGTEHDAIKYDSEQGWAYRTTRTGERIRTACKPSTVKAYLQAIKAFCKWLSTETGTANVTENIHTPKAKAAHKKDSLTPADVQRIERTLSLNAQKKSTEAQGALKDKAGRTVRANEQQLRDKALFSLAVNAGLRTVELQRASIGDLELRQGIPCLWVWGKGHAEPDTCKPLAVGVYDALKEYIASRPDRSNLKAPLFTATGNRSKGKRIASTTLSKMLKAMLVSAGFDSPRLTAHSLRHTAGQNVMNLTGNNIYNTQLYMRHASPATTEIYLDNEQAAINAGLAEDLYRAYHS